MDFNSYDDALLVRRYECFIDKYGNYYKVCLRTESKIKDNHNIWAESYIREKLNVSDFKFNPTTSALFTLVNLTGPSEILVNCFGYVYYSHDPIYYKPIIKVPDPKIGNLRVTEEQLDALFTLMTLNQEDTNIPIFFDENVYSYDGLDDDKNYKKTL